MKELRLDGLHHDQTPPKTGQIQRNRGDTINKNLPEPISQFSPNAMSARAGERILVEAKRAGEAPDKEDPQPLQPAPPNNRLPLQRASHHGPLDMITANPAA